MQPKRPVSFAELLRRYRREAGYSQAKLADEAELSLRGVSDLERGVRLKPRPETVRLLANALSLTGADRATFFAAAHGDAPVPEPEPERQEAPRVAQRMPPVADHDAPRDSDGPYSRRRHPHNLPAQGTPIVGRERELQAICDLLQREDVCLVTLTGPGGVGKTRLSAYAAHALLDAFPDGVWMVRLARLTESHLVLAAIAEAFGLKESRAATIAEVLQEYLCAKHLLLVLDNFEHVLVAAAEIARLLTACPQVKVLVTSRASLRLSAEHVYPVQPLPLPDLAHLPATEDILRYSSVALFIARATAVRADIEISASSVAAIARMCAHLDGLPLAIELAAARMRVLSPAALLKRLGRRLPLLTQGARDSDERHQTMASALAWSYDLLSPSGQRLFQTLAVFAGGCTLEAAEAVCAAAERPPPCDPELLNCLDALVDQSLVQRRDAGDEGESVRLSMLHVIREFALEQLASDGHADDLYHAHAQWCLSYAEKARDGMRQDPSQEPLWLDYLDAERDNVRVALGWALDHEQAELAAALAVAHGRYWWLRGDYRDGLAWFARVLALPAVTALLAERADTVTPSCERVTRDRDRFACDVAVALNDGLRLATELGVLVEHEQWVQASALLSHQVDAPEEEVRAHLFLHFLAQDQHRPLAEAAQHVQDALACAREAGHSGWIGACLSNLSALAWASGDLVQTEAYLEEALVWQRRARHPHGIARQLTDLAQLATDRGDYHRAGALAYESLTVSRSTKDPSMIAQLLVVLAASLGEEGHALQAARLLGAAVAASQTVGESLSDADSGRVEAAMRRVRAALGEERWTAAFNEGRRHSLEEALATLSFEPIPAR